MERDSIAASFRFRGERLLRPVGMVRSGFDHGALVWNLEAGVVKDRDLGVLGVESLMLDKLNIVLDRCLPEFRSRSLRIQIERGTMMRAQVLGVEISRAAGLAAVMVR